MTKGKTNNSGITLIALVISIIVLLILAEISISMLSGDNGLLNRTTEAKQNTERQQIIEIARIDILGKQTENHGSLSEQELIDILTSNDYNTKGTLSDNGEKSVLQKTLTSKDGKYEILVSDIYSGDLRNDDAEMISFTFKVFDSWWGWDSPLVLQCESGTTWIEWARQTSTNPIYNSSGPQICSRFQWFTSRFYYIL